jgi:hypothetical protein
MGTASDPTYTAQDVPFAPDPRSPQVHFWTQLARRIPCEPRDHRFLLVNLDCPRVVCRTDPQNNAVDSNPGQDRHARKGRTGPSGATCARKFHELPRSGSLVRLGDGIKRIRFIDGQLEVRPIDEAGWPCPLSVLPPFVEVQRPIWSLVSVARNDSRVTMCLHSAAIGQLHKSHRFSFALHLRK